MFWISAELFYERATFFVVRLCTEYSGLTVSVALHMPSFSWTTHGVTYCEDACESSSLQKAEMMLMQIQNKLLTPGYSVTPVWSRTHAPAVAAPLDSWFSSCHVDFTTWFFHSGLVTQMLHSLLQFVHSRYILMSIRILCPLSRATNFTPQLCVYSHDNIIIIIIIIIFLFLEPQDEVGPSISSSVVLRSFILLCDIVVLVLVVCVHPLYVL